MKIRFQFLLSFAATALLVVSSVAFGQARQVGGLQGTLPRIPAVPPTPIDAPDGAKSFLSSLKGNDAAMEVLLGQGRVVTFAQPLADENGSSLIAIGDPSVVEFEILPNPRMIRLLGVRPGVTDLTVVLADGKTHAFEVHVVYDLTLLRARMQQLFPTAAIRLGQIREHIVLEGQARSPAQVQLITETVTAYLASVSRRAGGGGLAASPAGRADDDEPDMNNAPEGVAMPELRGRGSSQVVSTRPRVINLMQVPKQQQVLLKVQVAELHRTGLREIGADLGAVTSQGSLIGTQIGGAAVGALSTLGLGAITGAATQQTGGGSTAFGIFPSSDFSVILQCLRQNNLLSILAEPNLIAMSGHNASFLAGGEYPVPIQSGVAGTAPTVDFKEFGVSLNFTPYVLDDGRIRLSVAPEVSNIDRTNETTLVLDGDPIPGVTTRRAQTTVELEQGHTLAMAGLLQLTVEAGTRRVPGLGDLPYIGPFFSNTSNRRVEKELVVLVTPYIVQPMKPHEVPPLPGAEIEDPTDFELYLLNRFEGRTGRQFRSTVEYDPFSPDSVIEYERCNIQGPVGFSTIESN